MEWVFNWPSGVLREQNLIGLSRIELFALEKDFSAYLSQVEAKYNKKPPKPNTPIATTRPRKASKTTMPQSRDRIYIDAAHDHKVIDQRLKKVLALGRR